MTDGTAASTPCWHLWTLWGKWGRQCSLCGVWAVTEEPATALRPVEDEPEPDGESLPRPVRLNWRVRVSWAWFTVELHLWRVSTEHGPDAWTLCLGGPTSKKLDRVRAKLAARADRREAKAEARAVADRKKRERRRSVYLDSWDAERYLGGKGDP